MRLRYSLAAMLVLVLAAGTALAGTHSIPVSGDHAQLTLANESPTALRYHIEVGTLEAMDVATKGGDFTRLLIPGFHSSQVDGAPELPMMNRLISVPFGATARVEMTNVQTRTVKLADFGVTSALMPHQPSLAKNQDPATVPFLYDAAAYAQTKVERPLAQVVSQGRLRAMDIARLEISPVRYLPASGELEVVSSFDLAVDFDGADQAAGEALRASTYSPFFQGLYTMVDGNRTFQDDYPDRVGDVVTMVIVTPPEFEAMLADYIAWKTERGFRVVVGVIGSGEVGSTTTSIRTYVQGLYNNATPELPAPSFVLFVGDVAQCPTFQESGDATDRPYCAVDADLMPDMYYGRMSATNPSQLQAQLDKTMMYETYSMPDPGYLDEVTMIAGVDGSYGPVWANGQINYGTSTYFNEAHGILSHTYLYPESGSAEAQIIQNLNDGVAYINYTAHGSETGWYDPALTQANVNSLTNAGKYCLAVGNCCLTSTYDYGECLGETFLRAPNKGAVGYIGGSNSTYWDEDYWWGVGYTSSIIVNPTYAGTHLGAYDGIFHEHGEAQDGWYVTNDAIVFAGNLAVTEAGSSRITYYWNIYNLLGDPSLSTWIGMPDVNPVTYPQTVFVGTPTFTITGANGTYVGLTQDGVLVGSGTIPESGSLDIAYTQVLTPGVPLKLVAMAQFMEPVITELNVIVPATVTINPMTIDANTPTAITVTVMDAGGVVPQQGINVWAEGLEYTTTPVMTNASGVAVINVNYPYGPTLDIVGQDPSETYRLFTEQVAVNAQALTNPDLTVTTAIGLDDAFPLNLPGTLHASVGQTGYTLYALMPDGSVLSSATSTLTATATEPGQVTGIIARSGYDLYSEAFDVIEAYGTVSGTVTTGGSPLTGVTVHMFDGANEVFAATTNGSGVYTAPEDILVANYTIVVDHFGYLHFEQGVFVNYGANTFDIALTAAPSGTLSGHVYDSVSLDPLEGATVQVYRADDGSLYTTATCDASGAYMSSVLPYFTYNIRVRAWHHVPVTAEVVVTEASTEKDWLLDPTMGDLVLIDDGAKSAFVEAKIDGKDQQMVAPEYTRDGGKSATELAADLEDLGYFVTMEDAASVDPATFENYDLVILTCGDNTTTLANAALKTGLVQFAQQGGHILLEGGELGYNQYADASFATWVLHSNDWNHDSAGTIQIGASSHAVATIPNDLTNTTIDLNYVGYGDSDGMVPLADATAVAVWTSYATEASIIAYDPNPAPNGGQIVYFCFNYAAAGAERVQLLENAVIYLLTPEAGTCSVSGHATLSGQSDASGITVRAIPNGGVVTTGADGAYTLEGLFAGPYTIVASKDGWSSDSATVSLGDNEHLTGVDFTLTPTATTDYCTQPASPINDNQTTTSVMPIADTGTVSEIAVYVDITHTYIGDLIVTLTAPDGTAVMLHNRSGGTTDDILGWYPDDITPAGDLASMIGCPVAGDWTLTVSDNAGGDTGTLNEWCVRITHGTGGATAVADDAMPAAFHAYANYPNPFNPMTAIKFDLPHASHVRLHVYDLAGRLVKTLVNEDRAAASHTVVWNGTDDTGHRVASGIYYYRLSTDTDHAIGKMTLVK